MQEAVSNTQNRPFYAENEVEEGSVVAALQRGPTAGHTTTKGRKRWGGRGRPLPERT